MSRFKKDFRDAFGNRVARHFDKYTQIVNPVTFDPLIDIYKEAFSNKEWNAMNYLLGTKMGKECLCESDSFDLYMPDTKGKNKYQRKRIAFGFPDGVSRPSLDLEYDEINPQAREKLNVWMRRALGLKELRQELWHRCDRLLDWGWDRYRVTDCHGNWRGGPTPGQGCNTAGQVYRIWPELLPFLNIEGRDKVRQSSVKSRLPDHILDYGSIEQFLCTDKISDDNGEDESDKALALRRRRFDALTHILVQMSLMMEVKSDPAYPTLN